MALKEEMMSLEDHSRPADHASIPASGKKTFQLS